MASRHEVLGEKAQDRLKIIPKMLQMLRICHSGWHPSRKDKRRETDIVPLLARTFRKAGTTREAIRNMAIRIGDPITLNRTTDSERVGEQEDAQSQRLGCV